MGSIVHEYDAAKPPDITTVDDSTFIILGTADLEKIQDHFDVSLPIDEYDTLSGFLIGQLRRIPTEGEKLELEYNGLLFQIESVQEKRIAKVRVSVISKEAEQDEC